MIKQCKNLFIFFRDWFLWLAPVSVFILALMIPTKLYRLDFLKFIDIVIWPITILTGLFFFKKVFTYLFFSMDEFNFFGLKGHLRNVNEVVLDEVNKRFLERQKEEERQVRIDLLNKEITKKEEEIASARGDADENLKIAKDVLASWKKGSQEKDRIIADLTVKNRRLSELVNNNIAKTINESDGIIDVIDDTRTTSDPILEEDNT